MERGLEGVAVLLVLILYWTIDQGLLEEVAAKLAQKFEDSLFPIRD